MDNSFKKVSKAFLRMIGCSPHTPGVYLFSDRKKEVLYVGKAINLQSRLKSYLDKNPDAKTGRLMTKAYSLKYFRVFSEIEALILEAALIKKYQPVYNLRLKDDKSFLYIGITKEEFPKVLAVRKRDLLNPKHLFGPFPSAKTVRNVLSFLRKIYPYCQQKTNRRPCFWSHLKLCNPCPGEIMQQDDKAISQQLKKSYLSNIRNLVSILNGKSKNLVSNLTRQMNQAVKLEDFEKAAFYRNQIQKLNYVTHNPHSLSSFLESPNFFEEEQKKELEDLEKVLQSFRHPELGSGSVTDRMPKQVRHDTLSRIECFDISNLSGQFAVGSMVVFIDGAADKSQYRRFKINLPCHSRESGNPDLRNDPGMIAEVLTRRLKHQEWAYPDLIVVDGGKPQISAALKVIQPHSIPVIGLAKRLETIIIAHPVILGSEATPESTENGFWTSQNDVFRFTEVNLDPDSPALNLLKRLRDEAHRFAVTYHRQLRRKSFLFD